jgi:hypothetical protein
MKSPKQIPLPLSSVKGSNSHSQCCICKRRGYKFIVVPSIVRYNTLIENNILIPPGARCCPGHIYDDNFNEEAVHNITDLNTETLFNKTETLCIIDTGNCVPGKRDI